MKSFLQGSLLLVSLFICTVTRAQTPPKATDLSIQGSTFIGSTLTGHYTYSDTSNRPEGNSIYKWYRADSVNQPDPQLIASDTTISYKTDTLDKYKFIAFEVTPVASGTGDSLVGTPVRIWTSHIITLATPPRAYDVAIQGALNVNSALSGIYSFSDTLNRAEGNSIYRWYRADSINQPVPELIDSAWTIAYQTDTIDNKKYIVFEVTPVTAGTGDSLVGTPVRVWTSHVISMVGIEEKNIILAVYPNPASSEIRIINGSRISTVEFYSSEGRKVMTSTAAGSAIDISQLSAGVYIVKAVFADGTAGRARIIKL